MPPGMAAWQAGGSLHKRAPTPALVFRPCVGRPQKTTVCPTVKLFPGRYTSNRLTAIRFLEGEHPGASQIAAWTACPFLVGRAVIDRIQAPPLPDPHRRTMLT